MDIAPDDTMVVRTDTYGAYIWNGTQWQQLVTSASMPAAFVAANPALTGKASTRSRSRRAIPTFCTWMYDGYVFKSTNKGTTWTETSFRSGH